MDTWMNRVSKVYTRKQQARDTAWIDALITADLKKDGLPVVGFDEGGWLQPGASDNLPRPNNGRGWQPACREDYPGASSSSPRWLACCWPTLRS